MEKLENKFSESIEAKEELITQEYAFGRPISLRVKSDSNPSKVQAAIIRGMKIEARPSNFCKPASISFYTDNTSVGDEEVIKRAGRPFELETSRDWSNDQVAEYMANISSQIRDVCLGKAYELEMHTDRLSSEEVYKFEAKYFNCDNDKRNI